MSKLKPFYYQLMHIMLKNTELLKHSKITLQHVSVYVYLHTVHDTHALQVTICSHSTDDALHIFYADTVNQMCNF